MIIPPLQEHPELEHFVETFFRGSHASLISVQFRRVNPPRLDDKQGFRLREFRADESDDLSDPRIVVTHERRGWPEAILQTPVPTYSFQPGEFSTRMIEGYGIRMSRGKHLRMILLVVYTYAYRYADSKRGVPPESIHTYRGCALQRHRDRWRVAPIDTFMEEFAGDFAIWRLVLS